MIILYVLGIVIIVILVWIFISPVILGTIEGLKDANTIMQYDYKKESEIEFLKDQKRQLYNLYDILEKELKTTTREKDKYTIINRMVSINKKLFIINTQLEQLTEKDG